MPTDRETAERLGKLIDDGYGATIQTPNELVTLIYDEMREALTAARAAERERCASEIERLGTRASRTSPVGVARHYYAAAIRALGDGEGE